jgi:hypothetical protein
MATPRAALFTDNKTNRELEDVFKPLTQQFTDSFLDKFYKLTDSKDFVYSEANIDNCLDFYFDQPKIFSKLPRLQSSLSKNLFSDDEVAAFKRLKSNPEFEREKFKTLLRIVLVVEAFETHIVMYGYPITSPSLARHIIERKNELRDKLIHMPSFQRFMLGHRDKGEILQELQQRNLANKEKLPSISLRVVEAAYNNLFYAVENTVVSARRLRGQLL